MAKLAMAPPTAPQIEPDGDGLTLSASVATRAEVLPNQEPNAPFFLSFHPYAWQVREGRVVANPLRVDCSPGCNGVGLLGGQIVITDAKAAQEAAGRTVILPDTSRPHADYIRRHRVPGGVFHIEKWGRPIPGTDRLHVDGAGYAAWLESLVTDGHIPGPSPEALGILLESLRGQREGYARIKNDELVKTISAQIAVVEAAIASVAPPLDGEGVSLG